jgi:hypothetical protein
MQPWFVSEQGGYIFGFYGNHLALPISFLEIPSDPAQSSAAA